MQRDWAIIKRTIRGFQRPQQSKTYYPDTTAVLGLIAGSIDRYSHYKAVQVKSAGAFIKGYFSLISIWHRRLQLESFNIATKSQLKIDRISEKSDPQGLATIPRLWYRLNM